MKLIIFSSLISLFSLIASQCDETKFNELKDSKEELLNIPLINGRCCKNKNTNDYQFVKEIYSLFNIQNENCECNTYIEDCFNTDLKDNILDISKCTNIKTEVPFKCCHVKFKNQAGCYPLDIHKDKYFGWYKTFFRARYGLFDADEVKIVCNSIFNNLSYLIIILFFSLIC